MRYIGYLWAIVLGRLLSIRSIRKWIYGGIVVGGVVGVIIALVKGYWPVIFVGAGVGFVLGISLGLIIRAVGIIRGRGQ